jgi:hypothetical protein
MCKAIMIITDDSQLFVKYQFALGLHVYDITYNSVYLHAQGQKYAFLQQLPAGLPKITI